MIIVFNIFFINNIIFIHSIFPGLNCLQRDFPCNRNTTPCKLLIPSFHIYRFSQKKPFIHQSLFRSDDVAIDDDLSCMLKDSSFAIKCGGSEMRSSNNILFETENSTTVGPASYYLRQEKWAVSNGGIVIDRVDPSFIASTTTQVDNTRYPELYGTSRKSPGSLRYFGLGLENGPYTISLFFAETVFNRTRNTWQGHGRRVFDIYIQVSYNEPFVHLYFLGKSDNLDYQLIKILTY